MHYSHDTHATHDTLSFIIITMKSSMSVKKYVLINDFFLIKPEVKLTSDFLNCEVCVVNQRFFIEHEVMLH